MSPVPLDGPKKPDDASAANEADMVAPQPDVPTGAAPEVSAAPAPTVDEVSEPVQPTASNASAATEPEVASVSLDRPITSSGSRGANSLPELSSTTEDNSRPESPSIRTPRSTHFADLHPATSPAPPHSRRSSGVPRRVSGSAPRPSLRHTAQDLRNLLKTFLLILPSRLRKLRILVPGPLRRLASAIVNQLAMVLHSRGALASSMFYDLLVIIWKTVITLFFREIRSRGAWKVPGDGEGAVIFVVGPHHNQFLDPLLLMSEVRREAGRRISFLVAAKSMDRKFIGQAAKLMQSIPVARAQDLAISGQGQITISEEDPLVIVGHGTSFKTQFAEPRCQIMLPRQFGNVSVEVLEVIDDEHLKVKKEFSKRAVEGLKAKAEAGCSFKILPHVDQTKMYSSVYKKLSEGGCIGIFPEGGSHDRTDLLPLKAGVSIMALGAISANPALHLRIVPVGLSYFHPHRFRSRAVVEFGSPIEIPREAVDDFEKGGDEKKKAIGDVMNMVVDGLKSVTIRAPDYETLMLIQATRRLYRPPGQHLTLGQIVELNKRFIAGYEVYKDEPRLQALVQRVKEYNTLLRYMGLKDHQIEAVARPWWRSFALLCYRLGLVSAWGVLALPGVILNSPIFIAASIISRKKAKEALKASTVKIKGKDVLATWKVLVALAGAPTLYTVYAIGAAVLAHKLDLPTKYKYWAPIATYAGLPLIGYSALKFGEVGMDVYKSLRPLFLSVVPGHEKQLDKLRTMRVSLQQEINELVEELAPAIFDDFYSNRIVPPSARPAPSSLASSDSRPGAPLRRRSTYGPQGQGTFLTHPMSWVDEYLFGWSQSQAPAKASQDADSDEGGATSDAEHGSAGGAASSGTRSGYVSGYTTEEPDYDEVIGILSREQGVDPSTTGATVGSGRAGGIAGSSRARARSRSRSRSHLDLTALDKRIKDSSNGKKSPTDTDDERQSAATAIATGVESTAATKRNTGKETDNLE